MNARSKLPAPLLLVLLLALSTAPALAYDKGAPTILDRLLKTDGAQAVVAAVLVVDEANVLGFSLAELLDDKRAEVILFAPSNAAFEKLLGLEAGTLNGLTVDEVADALPGIIGPLGVTVENVAAILLKHAALPRKAKPRTASENALLARGSVEVADGSVFPVGIGSAGVSINYETQIIKPNLFARNGVIHFIDTVIVDDLL